MLRQHEAALLLNESIHPAAAWGFPAHCQVPLQPREGCSTRCSQWCPSTGAPIFIWWILHSLIPQKKSISFSSNDPLLAISRKKKKRHFNGNHCSSPPLNIALPCALWFQLQVETSGTRRNSRLPKICLECQQYHSTCSDLLENWPQPDMCSFLGASPALRRAALPAACRQQHRPGSGFGGSWFCYRHREVRAC